MTSAPHVLDTTRSLVLPAMHKAVDRLDPATRTVVAYHLGWVDPAGSPTNEDGGKAIRPSLALMGVRATGRDPSVAVPGAVAVELVHNFSLVHDDIMDRDLTRRHRPTVWSVWDESTAILAGDAMLSLAHEVLLEDGAPPSSAASLMLARATRELIHGQVLDMQFEDRTDVTPAECIAMSEGKTAALLSASTAIGAVLADAPPPQVAALAAYGKHVGLAFQLIDDLLGIWGDPEVTGKSNHSDLRSKKMTLPMTWALSRPGQSAERLRDWVRHGPATDEALSEVARILEQLGARDWAQTGAHTCATRAVDSLQGAGLVPDVVDELAAVARYIADRRS